jgi:hypothetical protein
MRSGAGRRTLARVCGLACLFILFSPAFAQSDAAALLSRWVAAAPTAFRFVQERHLAILSHPIVSHGVVTRRADETILWHQTDPIEASLVIGADGIEGGEGPADEAVRGAVASIAGAVVDIFFGRAGHLAEVFDVTASDGRIVLVPKADALAVAVARIELEGSAELSEITLVEKSGDFTSIRLTPADAERAPR